MEPVVLISLGFVLVIGGFSLFRAQRKVQASQARDPLAEATHDLQSARESVVGQVRHLEVRLHEQARDLEAQLATRSALLDQLVAEADERIAALRSDLEEARKFRAATNASRSVAERRAA